MLFFNEKQCVTPLTNFHYAEHSVNWCTIWCAKISALAKKRDAFTNGLVLTTPKLH